MGDEVKGGRGPLLASAILHVISAILLGTSVGDSDPVLIRDAFRNDATVNVCMGAVFFGLWAWAKSNPLGASVSGLGLFLVVHVTVAIISPASLWFGLIPNIIIFCLMIRSVIAARAAKAWEKMERQK